MADPPDWQEARDERAAIMELDGGLTRADAEAAAARLHPDQWTPDPGGDLYGFTLPELQTAAGEDWPEIAAHPDTLQAFAFLRRTRAQRARGERPEHYMRAALCERCGPVWLWDPGPARVLACPWCTDPPPPGSRSPGPRFGAGAVFTSRRARPIPRPGLAPAVSRPRRAWPARPCGPRPGACAAPGARPQPRNRSHPSPAMPSMTKTTLPDNAPEFAALQADLNTFAARPGVRRFLRPPLPGEAARCGERPGCVLVAVLVTGILPGLRSRRAVFRPLAAREIN